MQLSHIHKTSQWPAHPMVCTFCNNWKPFSTLLQGNDELICTPCAEVLELEIPGETEH